MNIALIDDSVEDMMNLSSHINQSFAKFAEHLALYPEFLVCYRGCIINMMEVKAVNELCFLMSNGERIPFRSKQKAEIMKQYSDFLFEKNRKADL